LPPGGLPARLASAATTATTTVSAAATTTAAAAAKVTAADRLRPGLVDHQRASIELVLVEFVDRFLRVVVTCHFNERESARATGRLIAHHANIVDRSCSAEQLCEFFIRAFIREVAYVQSAAHRCETLSRASLSETVTCRRASDRTPEIARN
jgi:hypothetical protein